MAYTTINKSTDHFNTKLYTGTGSGNQYVTGVGFQPDWIWTKNRASAYSHNLYDAVRGVGKYLKSNDNTAESSSATSIISFDSDGFTVGTGDNVQYESANGVSWNWKAGGAGSANTDGSINSTVSANTTAGFSIVKYVGTGSGSNSTVGHGLGVKPAMIIVKNLGSTGNWVVWHKSLASETNNYLRLDTSQAPGTTTNYWNSAAPTNQVFGVSPDGYNNNKNGESHIAYCFAEKTGYSKFGSYVGNGSADGTFVFTGMKPAFVIVKNATTDGNEWVMHDNKRNTFNPTNKELVADNNYAEYDDVRFDFLSNGFKVRDNVGYVNLSGNNYIYMAFAEAPLVGSNNVPCTAR